MLHWCKSLQVGSEWVGECYKFQLQCLARWHAGVKSSLYELAKPWLAKSKGPFSGLLCKQNLYPFQRQTHMKIASSLVDSVPECDFLFLEFYSMEWIVQALCSKIFGLGFVFFFFLQNSGVRQGNGARDGLLSKSNHPRLSKPRLAEVLESKQINGFDRGVMADGR